MEELRPQVRSILFVCTGNVFRNVAAEHGLKTLLGQPSLYRIGSAGIEAKPQHLHERYPNWQQDLTVAQAYVASVIDMIWDDIPSLVHKLPHLNSSSCSS